MRIQLTSIYVDDQRAALAFYTDVLGFSKRHDIPLGGDQVPREVAQAVADTSGSPVVSPDSPDGPELLLEPAGHPAVKPYRGARRVRHPVVDDVEAE